MEEQPKTTDHRTRPTSAAFEEFIAQGWAPRPSGLPDRAEVAPYAAARRDEVSAAYPGERLVVPAGGLKVRSNDTDYVFRPHSAFAHLTGLGGDREPDAVLVLEPRDDGTHEPVFYFRPMAGRDTDRDLTRQLDEARASEGAVQEDLTERDDELAHFLSVLRLTKDEWEVDQMRRAVAATHTGFEAVIADLPEAVRRGRGERWVEGVFGLTARHEGNGVGYDSICASGDHATTLHWIRNTGDLRPGDLLLLDAGVEMESLYPADVTRTLPVDGTFTEAQREIYDAVLAAQEAGLAAVRPGNKFSDVH